MAGAVDLVQARLARAGARLTPLKLAELAGLEGRLKTLGPGAVLRRGYALVRNPAGHVIADAAGLEPAARVRVDFRDGHITATVESVSLDGTWSADFAPDEK